MDKFSNLTKGGWHPAGDRQIHRDTWKQDLKGIATRKKNDPREEALNHRSAPLSSLRDPDSFGPPPKHTAYYGPNANAPRTGQSSSAASGWGAPVPSARPKPAEQPVVEAEPPKPPEPYRVNTTGLRTDNLPKPPTRAGTGFASPASTASPSLPPRVPPRQAQAQPSPPPILPPRQNEYPDEYTPAPPPPYSEATRQPAVDTAAIQQSAAQRLGQAGVSVPGFGIGQNSNTTPQSPARGPQLNELQQRFARLNTGTTTAASSVTPASPTTQGQLAAAAAHKKPPPPPPKKKPTLNSPIERIPSEQGPAPPPLPLSSKPRPT